MKIIQPSHSCRGSVLITTLFIASLVGGTVLALLFVADQQNRATHRSRVWNSEIPIAEAGVEEALAHMNSNPSRYASRGWIASGTNFVKYRTNSFTNAYFYTMIASSREPTIISVGYARVPLQTNYTQRTVVAMTTRTPPKYGFVAKERVILDGTTFVDSFDSSIAPYPTSRTFRAGVASTSSLRPAIITGSAKIYAYAATGPGGSVSGNVGDRDYFILYGSGQQPGHVVDDFNMAIMDVVLPNTTWRAPGGSGGGSGFQYILGQSGDYVVDSIKAGGKGIKVNKNITARLWVRGDIKITSDTGFHVEQGAHIELYVGGTIDVTGQPVVNENNQAVSCLIYGLRGCTDIKFGGNAAMYARIYAPHAAVSFTGESGFFGSIVGKSIRCSGTAALHYDEALGRSLPSLKVSSWEEM